MGQKLNVLFLDHDGVICLPDQWGKRTFNSEDVNLCFDKFDPKSIKVLNKIIEYTNCEIVISSDWRFHCDLFKMQELYQIRGIKKSPIDYTTTTGIELPIDFKLMPEIELEQTRFLEIEQYLKNNPQIKNWVAVDDLDLRKNISNKKSEIIETRYWGLNNFVWTNKFNEGIKQCGVFDKIIYYLGR